MEQNIHHCPGATGLPFFRSVWGRKRRNEFAPFTKHRPSAIPLHGHRFTFNRSGLGGGRQYARGTRHQSKRHSPAR